MLRPPAGAERRVGIHLPTAGGVCRAPERAHVIGANTFQIFSSSPRMWRGSIIAAADGERMTELRLLYNCSPLVIHASYLINLCSQSEPVRANSIKALRGEIERALALKAEYLVLHPGSWKGLSRRRVCAWRSSPWPAHSTGCPGSRRPSLC
jgi:deoxyribonuclease-4